MKAIFTWKTATLLLVVTALAATAFTAQKREKKLTGREVRRALATAEDKIEEGNLPEAGGIYLRVLQDYPERGDVHLMLARIYRDFEEWENAASAYAKAAELLEKPEELAECYEVMTQAYVQIANYPQAVEVGRKAIEASPSSATAHVNLALGLAKTGDLEGAADMARKALELAPDSALAHSTLGEAAMAEGNTEEAEAAFRKAIELDDSTAESHAGLADILFAKEDYEGAVQEATKALDLNDKLTRAYGIRGKANNALGKADMAYSDLAMAITVNANDPDANLAFAQVYHAQGNAAMAMTYYEKAIALNPGLNDAYLALGELLIQQGQASKAGDVMKQAAERMPDDPKVQELLGSSLENSGDYDGALAAYTKATELDSGNAMAHYKKGKILRERKQDFANGLAALESAVAAGGSDNSDIMTEYGVALYHGGQLDKSLEVLQQVEATPDYDNPLGFGYLGVTLKDKQQFAESAVYFKKAVGMVPNWGLAHWGLAWSSFGQIKKDCPCDGDEQLVTDLVEHTKQAAALGVNDPALAERADIIGRGEKVK